MLANTVYYVTFHFLLIRRISLNHTIDTYTCNVNVLMAKGNYIYYTTNHDFN